MRSSASPAADTADASGVVGILVCEPRDLRVLSGAGRDKSMSSECDSSIKGSCLTASNSRRHGAARAVRVRLSAT